MSDLAPTGKLEIGRVISETFAVLGRNFSTFAVLAVILVGIPAISVGFLQMNFLKAGSLFSLSTVLGGIVAAVASLILQGAIIYATISDMNGRRASVPESLGVGLRSALPVLGVGIVMYLGIMAGTVLLIVPGLMLMTAWIVCVPVVIAERGSLGRVFGRSAALTKGNRWRILGLALLFFVAIIIVEAVTGMLGNASRLAAGGGIPRLQALITAPLLSVASTLLGAIGIATMYAELRRLKDGVGPEGLAAIFD
jgi:hypothetical protein